MLPDHQRVRVLATFVLAMVAIGGCGLAPASPPIAPDQPFEGDAAAATDWARIELVFPNGVRSLSVGPLDEVGPALRRYFSLGVRPIDENAVRVTLPDGHEEAAAFRALVTVTGGVNRGQAGSQFRVWARRTGGGWSIDNQAEARRFCRIGVGGISGTQCAGG